MAKRILMILAVAALLVGCSSQQEADDPNTDQSITTESASTPSEEATTNEEPTEPVHEHTYIESVTTEATCEADGVKTFACDCGDSYTEAITATGHNYEEVADSAVSATCDTDGNEADTKCFLCESVVEGAVIPASGHSYGEYVYNNDATQKADGTETATCSVCGGKDTRSKAGTKLPVENFPHALNAPWYDEAADQVYFYTVGTADPISEPYPTAFNMAREVGINKHITKSFTMSVWVGKFNEFVGTYAEGDVYLSSVRIEYEFK